MCASARILLIQLHHYSVPSFELVVIVIAMDFLWVINPFHPAHTHNQSRGHTSCTWLTPAGWFERYKIVDGNALTVKIVATIYANCMRLHCFGKFVGYDRWRHYSYVGVASHHKLSASVCQCLHRSAGDFDISLFDMKTLAVVVFNTDSPYHWVCCLRSRDRDMLAVRPAWSLIARWCWFGSRRTNVCIETKLCDCGAMFQAVA